ncbi:MAG: HNH endonuclease [Thermomicrobiales bacterium]
MQDNSTPSISNPSGLCECGCGQITPIAPRTRNVIGHVRGEHIRFIHGHCGVLGRGIPKTGVPPKKMVEKRCAYCGTSYSARWAVRNRSLFCGEHCRRLGRNGRTLEGDAVIDNGDGTTSIPLGRGIAVIIDTADVERVRGIRWTAVKSGRRVYAYANTIAYKGMLHRRIVDAPDGVDIDHWDGDGLNDRRSNLRIATRSQNMVNVPLRSNNTSGYVGVSWSKASGKWRSAIKQNDRQIHLGLFTSAAEAARAYDLKARELFGEFARLNLPDIHD